MARDLTEKTLSSELVYQGKFLKIRKDVAGLPDGKTASREYIQHPGAAAMVPLFDDGRILVERQFRYAVKQTFIEIPAGKLDAGEDSLTAAKRELLEETGHLAAEWGLLTSIHPAIGFADERIDIYLCKGLTVGQQSLDEGEFVELEVVTLGWLMDELRAGRLTDVKTQIAVQWMDRIVSGQWPWPQMSPA